MLVPNCGVIFCATGDAYYDEAVATLKRLLCFTPSINVSLFTDKYRSNDYVFHQVFINPSPEFSYSDKIYALINSPYHSTLYLDTDACPIVDVTHSFNVLDRFDLAACYAPVRIPVGWCDHNVPDFFPEINTGVIFYKNLPIIRSMFENWSHLYRRLFCSVGQVWDQASFRSVLWKYYSHQVISFFMLPSEYNLRLTKPWVVGKGSFASIIHGRVPNDEWNSLTNYLNNDINKFRTYSEWYSIHPTSRIKLKPPISID